jgi:aspartate racemase
MVDAACARAGGARRAGLIAVAATLDAGLYHNRLAAAGIETIEPDRADVAALVARVKAGETGPGARDAAAAIAAHLAEAGADIVIAACTEIPLVLDGANCPLPLVDSTQALAEAVLQAARR